MKTYVVNQPWDDPFDHLSERRRAARFPYRTKLIITAATSDGRRRLVGPGIMMDLSLSGVKVITKHKVEIGQHVGLELRTEPVAHDACMPDAFKGSAVVVRSIPGPGRRSEVALSFNDDLALNMEFALYVDRLQAVSKIASPGGQVA